MMSDKKLKKRRKKINKLEKKLNKQLKKVQKIQRKIAKIMPSAANTASKRKVPSKVSHRFIEQAQSNSKHTKAALNIDVIELETFDRVELDSVYKPYKSSPCKKCPALASGMCKCALKRINRAA